MTKRSPDNREYKLELAEYNDNLAILVKKKNPALAKQRSGRAIELITQLGEPAPYLRMQLALAHSIRGAIIERADPRGAQAEYQLAINTFENVPRESQNRYFHMWFGQALTNLAEVSTIHKQAAVQFLLQAIDEHKAAGSNIDLAWDYYFLAVAYRDIKSFDSMRHAIDSSRGILPELAGPDREELTKWLNEISASRK